MGLWDIIKQAPLPKPHTTIPDHRILTDPERHQPTVGDAIDTAKAAVKAVRNAGRRFKSLFDDDDEKELKRGDIIGICRGAYDHYGVYIDDYSVIHYSSKDSDTSSENSIIETSLDTFMRGDGTLFRLSFPDTYGKPDKIVTNRGVIAERDNWFRDWEKYRDYKLYSPDETIERARSRLGENKYSLLFNNCEHFAIWCKTGISESHQINDLLKKQRDCIVH